MRYGLTFHEEVLSNTYDVGGAQTGNGYNALLGPTSILAPAAQLHAYDYGFTA